MMLLDITSVMNWLLERWHFVMLKKFEHDFFFVANFLKLQSKLCIY